MFVIINGYLTWNAGKLYMYGYICELGTNLSLFNDH